MKTALAKKESSPALSTLAAEVLALQPSPVDDEAADIYNTLLAKARRLAASVLAQDETKGQAK